MCSDARSCPNESDEKTYHSGYHRERCSDYHAPSEPASKCSESCRKNRSHDSNSSHKRHISNRRDQRSKRRSVYRTDPEVADVPIADVVSGTEGTTYQVAKRDNGCPADRPTTNSKRDGEDKADNMFGNLSKSVRFHNSREFARLAHILAQLSWREQDISLVIPLLWIVSGMAIYRQ
jgi:hypothetical protein